MPVTDRDVASRAFCAQEWLSASDALLQATGASVTAMDFERCITLSGPSRCAYCHLASTIDQASPTECFDVCPDPDSGPGRVLCRAGFAALYAPVLRENRTIAHCVVTGFVTSTRERRRLYEQMLNRGMTEDAARKAIKSLPVIPRGQAEAYLQMAVASANTVVSATAERLIASQRIEELRLFVSAGQQVVATERLDLAALSAITEEAVAMVGGEAGAVLRPRGIYLEVAAKTQDWRGILGAVIPRQSTAAGRAMETGRMVVAKSPSSPTAAVALPLAVGDRILGVLEVRVSQQLLPLSKNRASRLSRFGQFIAIALEREDERAAVERATAGYAALNGLASELGGRTDLDDVVSIAVGALSKTFEHQLCGMIVTGWGRDRADVMVSGQVCSADVNHVLEVVSGRSTAEEPFTHLQHRGDELAEKGDIAADEWAISAVELSHGDLEVGWLFVARYDGERYGRQDRALLEGVAGHVGSALGRTALFSRIRDDYAKTIAAFSAMMDLGERAPTGHAGRVMEYAMMVGEEMALPHDQIEQLRFAGLLHDIGKTGVPEEILLKPSKLSADELVQVQRHAEMGATIVDQIDFLKSLTPVILHHHERWDGTGYPTKLQGEAIPLLARILCVADAFDSMTGDRTYKKKMTIAQARMELEQGAGTQFDPRVVAAFLEAMQRSALIGATGLLAPHEARGRRDLPA